MSPIDLANESPYVNIMRAKAEAKLLGQLGNPMRRPADGSKGPRRKGNRGRNRNRAKCR